VTGAADDDVVRAGPLWAAGLVAVHAHPDDETLATGALIASYAAAGLPVTVVTCTRGERGEVLALPGTTSEGLAALEGDGPALAAHRERELAAALTALGGGDPAAVGHAFLDQLPPPVLSDAGEPGGSPASDTSVGERFEDSGMVWLAPGIAGPDPAVSAGFARVPLDDAAGRLAVLIRALRPAAVATYEAGGGYGHPDHVRTHDVTVRALALAADPGFDGTGEPWQAALFEVVAPAGELVAARRALADDPAARTLAEHVRLDFPAATDPLPAVARDDAALAVASAAGRLVEVEVAPVLGRVLGAMRAHATQIQHAQAHDAAELRTAGVLGWYALSNGVLTALRARETYAVTPPASVQATSVGSAR
jgi:N-acetyl-1-D-myo-inositol-2-amino-2-deoxy-alpha-D-glucopyranoside deacetylase